MHDIQYNIGYMIYSNKNHTCFKCYYNCYILPGSLRDIVTSEDQYDGKPMSLDPIHFATKTLGDIDNR